MPKDLYDELESVEWRQYTDLDDKALDLLEKVDVASLGEANLDFAFVQLMFLPDELEHAEAAFEAARSTASADRWRAWSGMSRFSSPPMRWGPRGQRTRSETARRRSA